MGRSERQANSIRTFAQHADLAYSVAEGAAAAPDIEPLSTSWRRSATRYGVDPADGNAPRILTSGELKEFREPLGKLIFSAQEEIDRLYKVVREAGYTILFCDTAGVAVEHRGEAVEASLAVLNIGEPGSAASGPRKSRGPTASAPASPKSGRSPCTEVSTSDRGTWT